MLLDQSVVYELVREIEAVHRPGGEELRIRPAGVDVERRAGEPEGRGVGGEVGVLVAARESARAAVDRLPQPRRVVELELGAVGDQPEVARGAEAAEGEAHRLRKANPRRQLAEKLLVAVPRRVGAEPEAEADEPF